MLRRWFAPLVVVLALVSPIVAQDAERRALLQPTAEAKGICTIGDQKVDYVVTAGRLAVKDMTGKAEGKIFFVSYTRPTDKPGGRPITFCFNGGPGASSSYLHVGAFGPRRVALADDGKSFPSPAKLVDNDCSLIDATDLVFVDPISTGWSRADHAKDAKLFYGLDPDARSVGDFIRSYVAMHKREESPTFLMGESYGTTRASAIAQYLQSRGGVKLAGLLMISMVLDFSTISTGNGDQAYAHALPTYTASALHHKKLDGDPKATLAEAEKFAAGPFAAALRQGKDLDDGKRRELAKSVAKYTALSEEFVLKANLRVGTVAFRSELFRESKEVLGRFDSRIKGSGGKDPSHDVTTVPYAACIREYLAGDLKATTELKYNVLVQVQPWNMGGTTRGRANVTQRLRLAMEKDESLRVFVACGTCDLATPYSAAKHTMAQFDTPSLQSRITIACYEAGHMIYTVRECHKTLRDDLVRFIAAGQQKMATAE